MATTISFGTTPNGTDVHLFVLSNRNGMCMAVSDLGACITRLIVPDAHGNFRDVVLGLDGPGSYSNNSASLGATVGRNANRIGQARFMLDGTEYRLEANDRTANHHAGSDYWFHRLWEAKADEVGNAVTFHLDSPDGDQGFPGAVSVDATFTLTEDNAVIVDYDARPSARTVINMTQHSYFNLNGHASGTILDHTLQIDADCFTEVTSDLIPTGRILPVDGTALDFRTPRRIGNGLGSPDGRIGEFGGYDHNFCLSAKAGAVRHAATLEADRSGIVLEVLTDLPGIQIYTSNVLDEAGGKDGKIYGVHEGICLETQFYPDAINKPGWPQPIFGPENPYRSRTVFRFTTRQFDPSVRATDSCAIGGGLIGNGPLE